MKILKLPLSEDITENRLDALRHSLLYSDPKYLSQTIDILLDALEEFEGYAVENSIYRLEEAKAWLSIGFGNGND